MLRALASALCVVVLGCGTPSLKPSPPAATAVASTAVTLTEASLGFERIAVPKEPKVDVMLFGELRPAYVAMLEKQAPGASFKTLRMPPGKRTLAFSHDPARVFVLDPDKGIVGSWPGDDAVYRSDDELVIRRASRCKARDW